MSRMQMAMLKAITSEAILAELVQESVAITAEIPLRNVDRSASFSALGLDSLQVIGLKTRLEDQLGIELPDYVGYEYPSVDALATYLWQRLRTDTMSMAPSD